jgi:NADH-quinone oxidoreductase subunit L
MGGLRQHMPITAYTFLASCAAIAGFPMTSGFYSKDEILHHDFTNLVRPPTDDDMIGPLKLFMWPSWADPLLLTAGLLGAVLTAFYMFRLYIITFEGDFRGWKIVSGWQASEHDHEHHDDHSHDDLSHGDHGHDHGDHSHSHSDHGHGHATPLEGPTPHESPWQMYLPLVILGVLALCGGFLFAKPLDEFLEPVFAAASKSIEVADTGGFVMGLAIGAAFLGIGAAAFVYLLQKGAPAKALAEQFPGLHRLLLEKWRVDELYDELFIGTVDFIADLFVWVDKWIVDGIVARLTAWLVQVAGHLLRLTQTGRIQAYAAVMMIGTAGLGWFFTMPQARAHVDRDDASGHYTVVAAPGLGYAYRWDADADGKPDSEKFSEKKSVELSLGLGESRTVVLEVRNAFGRVGSSQVVLKRAKAEEAAPTALGEAREGVKVAGLAREVSR